MEVKWLEDFVSLAETRSFRVSAELRHVTQPAFSRRIQTLEAWLGVSLIDRTSHPMRLTAAGQKFHEHALHLLVQINSARASLKSGCPAVQPTIDFAVPHTLSLGYLSQWMTKLRAECGAVNSRLRALNVQEAVNAMADGGCDLLLCYHHPRQPVQLPASRYDMLVLGEETVRAYARCDKKGIPDLCLPGDAKAPLPLLSYAEGAFLAQMVDLILEQARQPLHFEKRYEADLAEALKMMALEGHGIAFLPESAVIHEVKEKRLARADGGRMDCELGLEVRLYRERPTLQRPGKPIVSKLWSMLLGLEGDQAAVSRTRKTGKASGKSAWHIDVSEEVEALANVSHTGGGAVERFLMREAA